MGLVEYQRKRRFARTPEPRGKVAQRRHERGLMYVIQKHAASRLHYDFRLELDGVLKSWAVPKGPSLDPAVRPLAVQVEDHPVEYGSFEGVIPPGEYGGGTVMLWDRGTWRPVGDARDGLRKGKLHFILEGEKLRGEWLLVRMHSAGDGARENWLLRKIDDKFAKPGSGHRLLESDNLSVASGRDLEQIAGNPQRRTWSSQRTRRGAHTPTAREARISTAARPRSNGVARRASKGRRRKLDPSRVAGAKLARQPAFVKPQLATLVRAIPQGDEWLHEVKFDGYRLLCIIRDGKAKFLTRNAKDWTARFRDIANAAAALPIESAIIDGEIAAVDAAGRTDFQALQNAMRAMHPPNLTYYLFDLIYVNGYDLRGAALTDRKQILADLLSEASPPLQFSAHVLGAGGEVFQEACRLGLEGVISKRVDSVYASRRNGAWTKTKCTRGQEFIIGGFTDPGGTRTAFGALLLGYYDKKESLRYCGRVGTGFSQDTLHQLHDRMVPLEIDRPPFINPPRGADARGAHWLRPKLVAEIIYGEMTREGMLRHPVFHGLREDKPAREVKLEEAPAMLAGATKAAQTRHKARTTKSISTVERDGDIRVAGVKLSNPEKVLYPEQGLTKRDLAEYYAVVGPRMLPHVKRRPIMMVRCPQGRGKHCFYQKHMNEGVPDPWRGVAIKEGSATGTYVVVDDLKGLVALAQIGVLEIHTWGSRDDRIEQPDQLVFDLDPAPDVAWRRVIDAARAVRTHLANVGLESFVKTTGGKGLHVVVPLSRRAQWPEVKAFAKAVADALVADDPQRYIATMSKSKRAGKIFIDYLRNGRGSTAIAAYSTRARPNAPVSMPVRWEDLDALAGADQFRLQDAAALANAAADPWEGFFKSRQALTARLLRKMGVA